MRSKKIHRKQIKKKYEAPLLINLMLKVEIKIKKKNMAYKLKSNIKELKLKTLCC
jgi:hypothetical protein